MFRLVPRERWRISSMCFSNLTHSFCWVRMGCETSFSQCLPLSLCRTKVLSLAESLPWKRSRKMGTTSLHPQILTITLHYKSKHFLYLYFFPLKHSSFRCRTWCCCLLLNLMNRTLAGPSNQRPPPLWTTKDPEESIGVAWVALSLMLCLKEKLYGMYALFDVWQ